MKVFIVTYAVAIVAVLSLSTVQGFTTPFPTIGGRFRATDACIPKPSIALFSEVNSDVSDVSEVSDVQNEVEATVDDSIVDTAEEDSTADATTEEAEDSTVEAAEKPKIIITRDRHTLFVGNLAFGM